MTSRPAIGAPRRIPLFVCVSLLILCRVGSASARERVAIATSLITPFFDAYYLEGKVRATSSVALVFSTSYLTLTNEGWKTRAGTAGAGLSYYFRDSALRGWHAEAIGELWLASQRHEASRAVAPAGVGYAGIVLVGYQLVFDTGPFVDVGVGAVGFHLPTAEVTTPMGSISSGTLTRIYPAAKINVGWAF